MIKSINKTYLYYSELFDICRLNRNRFLCLVFFIALAFFYSFPSLASHTTQNIFSDSALDSTGETEGITFFTDSTVTVADGQDIGSRGDIAVQSSTSTRRGNLVFLGNSIVEGSVGNNRTTSSGINSVTIANGQVSISAESYSSNRTIFTDDGILRIGKFNLLSEPEAFPSSFRTTVVNTEIITTQNNSGSVAIDTSMRGFPSSVSVNLNGPNWGTRDSRLKNVLLKGENTTFVTQSVSGRSAIHAENFSIESGARFRHGPGIAGELLQVHNMQVKEGSTLSIQNGSIIKASGKVQIDSGGIVEFTIGPVVNNPTDTSEFHSGLIDAREGGVEFDPESKISIFPYNATLLPGRNAYTIAISNAPINLPKIEIINSTVNSFRFVRDMDGAFPFSTVNVGNIDIARIFDRSEIDAIWTVFIRQPFFRPVVGVTERADFTSVDAIGFWTAASASLDDLKKQFRTFYTVRQRDNRLVLVVNSGLSSISSSTTANKAARVLDTLDLDQMSPEMLDVYEALYKIPEEDNFKLALNEISPEVNGIVHVNTSRIFNRSLGTVDTRLSEIRSGAQLQTGLIAADVFSGAGGQAQNFDSILEQYRYGIVNGSDSNLRRTALSSDKLILSEMIANLEADNKFSGTGWWVQPFASIIEQDKRGNVDGFESDFFGVAFGGDKLISDNIVAGVAMSYASGNLESTGASLGNNTEVKSFQVTGYASYNNASPWYVDGLTAIALNNYNSIRDLEFLDLQAKSDYEGIQIATKLSAGYRFYLSNNFIYSPNAYIQYSFFNIDAYTETGAEALNLDVENQTSDNFTLGIGGTLSRLFTYNDDWFVRPEITAMYIQDLQSDISSIESSFINDGGAFTTTGPKSANAGARIDVGLTMLSSKNLAIKTNYFGEFRSGFESHSAYINLRFDF